MYISAVVSSWCSDCFEAGVEVLFQQGRKLMANRAAKLRLGVERVTESHFADNVALNLETG